MSSATPGCSKSPAAPGHAVLEDPDLVVLALGRGRELPDDERRVPARRHDEVGLRRPRSRTCARPGRSSTASSLLGSVEVAARATSPRCRARSRRPPRRRRRTRARARGSGAGAAGRRSSARCAPARGSARAATQAASGPPAACASAPETCQKPWSSSRQRSHEERCSSKARALGRVERVERVAGGQLVNVHEFLSAPSSSSSSRRRERPENILLLIVPSGCAEPLGELRLGVAAVVRELDRLALLVGKLRERRLHARPLEAQPRRLLRRALGRLGRALERLGAPALLAPDEVDRAPVDERQDPGRRLRALGDERAGAPPERRGTPPAPRPRRATRRAGSGRRARRRSRRPGRRAPRAPTRPSARRARRAPRRRGGRGRGCAR